MKAIVKILLALEIPDDPAARRRFQEIVSALEPVLPGECEVRDFKMVEDGTGRLLETRDAR
ncbi:hypothetical protein JW916_12950 [Candidatus Sumerlaeota bacterium]|nr:hypothetical protein [Candidatus Sumerlaeota bacterium]